MKTYKGKSYNQGVWSDYIAFDDQRLNSACTCIKKPHQEEPFDSYELFANCDCENCLGYGIMPIPPSELK